MPKEKHAGTDQNTDFSLEKLFYKYRYQVLLVLVGATLIGLGVLLSNGDPSEKIEIIGTATENGDNTEMVVEVSGAVEKPGVYKLDFGSRIEDALILAGGISSGADREWMEKALNRAAKLIDGQKIYIPKEGEQSTAVSANNSGGYQTTSSPQGSNFSSMVNVNSASQKELESLWGIGPVTAQNIIEQRPYSSVEELRQKKILKSNVYERNKDLLSVY